MSMLKVWQVRKTSIHVGPKPVRALQITCPHCESRAYVSKAWAEPHYYDKGDEKVLIVGRSCTYCMKTAQVPEKFKGGKPRG